MDNPPLTNDPHRQRLSQAQFEALRALHRAVRQDMRTCHAAAIRATGYGNPKVDRYAESTRQAVHEAGRHHRIAILAWAFVRGLPYRRVEPQRHLQVTSLSEGAVVFVRGDNMIEMHGVELYEHHRPDVAALHALLVRHIPDLAVDKVDLWLAEPHKASGSKLSAIVQAFADRIAAEVMAEQVVQNQQNLAAQLPLPLAS